MNPLIHNLEQLQEFSFLYEGLLPSEVIFVSLSARNKYLEPEDRILFGLARTEMFGRRIIKHPVYFVDNVDKLLNSLPSFTTRSGKPIPEKALVVYANINPSSGILAYEKFTQLMNEKTRELLMSPYDANNNKWTIWKDLEKNLMTEFQRARGRKIWVDIDCDAEFCYVYPMLKRFKAQGVDFKVLQTKSGYHVLLRVESLKYNYKADVEDAQMEMEYALVEGKADPLKNKEIIFNANEMVPIAGVYQGLTPVSFIDWE